MLTASVDWQCFIEQYWEKTPVQLDGLGVIPVFDSSEVFQAMTEKREFGPSDRFWVKHEEQFQKAELSIFGPRADDKTLDGYLRRISGGQNEVGLNLQSLQVGSPALWFRLRSFVRGLLQGVPLPSQRWDVDCFLGNYRTTPFGIHADSASVFAFGVMGRRTYYAWPQAYFQPGHPDLHQAGEQSWQKHLKHAIRLELTPGRAIYWPSSHWHVVTSDGSPSLVVQLSAYFGASLPRYFGQLVTRHLEQTLTTPQCSTFSHAGDELKNVLDLLRPELLRHKVDQSRLTRLSADGFTSVPSLDQSATVPERLRLEPNVKLYSLVSGQDRQIFCNGLSFMVQNAPVMDQILGELEKADDLPVREFLDRFADFRPARSVLLGLARRRAFA